MPRRAIAPWSAREVESDDDDRHRNPPHHKSGANLFLELSLSAAEAKKLHAVSRKQMNDTRLLKQQLMTELSS